MSKNDRYVVRNPEGRLGCDRAEGRTSERHYDTQRQADGRAKEIVGNLVGGEVRIQGRDGRWRDSDTVPPANHPNPPEDRKH